MRLPYVVDNRTHGLADILNDLLHSDAVHALDVATGYFNVAGFALLRQGLEQLASLRLLLGSQPDGPRSWGYADPFGATWSRRATTGRRFARWRR